MDSNLQNKFTEQFFKAVLSLESLEEAYKFFEDVCTINEVKALSQRLEVARLLNEGATYEEIGKATGASTATISRVKRFLNYGAGGYQLVFDKLDVD
ncbi:YerC/YecD family TrpR-related protein [Fuchsiella alkaliacetigena]|uniref:YerC/YecD family TrpR-related protein n=1 Tax=Fuchsiella alkaliacetigena TaxID=957042 RepID=UPI00200A26CD|nr:YerC/YecD family TrpR-related protein [Fuchsiella alkaliacetigena]MCK8824410.1 YerC/YecD family TrpR-related protein [Fuchsiella alkaliacetigena]